MSRSRKKPLPEPLELEINDLSHDGRGVARHQGKAVFVFGALPGEKVLCQIQKQTRHFDEGQALEILVPSSERVEPECEAFGRCGGCVLQHLSASAQIRLKQKVLFENLKRIGLIEAEEMAEPLHDVRWNYRRKARLSGRYVNKKERFLLGFRERDGRFVAELDKCPVLDHRFADKIGSLGECLGQLHAKREIPQVEVAGADEHLAIVVRHMRELPEQDLLDLKNWCQTHQCQLYLQPKGPDSVHALDEPAKPLSFSLEKGSLKYQFKPLDFIQVNAAMNEKMVAQAMDWLQPDTNDQILDLFCGLGNFTLPLAKRVKQVTGVEGEQSLVDRAHENAKQNGLDNIHWVAADLRHDHSQSPWLKQAFTKILLDPPRSGAQEIIPLIASLKVPVILYVSCHPGSLARDAGMLVRDHGYRLLKAGAMDMFPHTAHVESMALFVKAK